MPILSAVAFAAALSSAPATVFSCSDGNTIEMNQCLSERLSRREKELATYVSAARNRIQQETGHDGVPTSVLQRFDAAEKAWWTYRDAQCDAVYDYWSAGAIRGMKFLKCRIILTQSHAHTVWSEWLGYMDDTPPLLPEPPPPTFP